MYIHSQNKQTNKQIQVLLFIKIFEISLKVIPSWGYNLSPFSLSSVKIPAYYFQYPHVSPFCTTLQPKMKWPWERKQFSVTMYNKKLNEFHKKLTSRKMFWTGLRRWFGLVGGDFFLVSAGRGCLLVLNKSGFKMGPLAPLDYQEFLEWMNDKSN